MAAKTLQDYIKQATDSLAGVADAGTQNIGQIAIMALLSDYINKQQDKNFGTNPYTGAISDVKAQRTNYQNLFTNAAAGETTNPAVATLRDKLASRAYNAPVTAPTVTPPARFNPYAAGGAGAGGADADLMSSIKSLATGKSAGYDSGMGALNQSLANRFGTRSMRQGNIAGALTPLGSLAKPAATVTTPVSRVPTIESGQLKPYTGVTPNVMGEPGTEQLKYNQILGTPGSEQNKYLNTNTTGKEPGWEQNTGTTTTGATMPVTEQAGAPGTEQLPKDYATAQEAFAAEGLGGLIKWQKRHPAGGVAPNTGFDPAGAGTLGNIIGALSQR